MKELPSKVQNDWVVGISYELRLDDGEVVDSAPADEPLYYLHGYQNIIDGLENALGGLAVGQNTKVTVLPDEAYGDPDPDAFVLIPYGDLPPDLEVEVGEALVMEDENSGEVMTAYVSRIGEDGLYMDLNHPLAGQSLHFNVSVVSLRKATQEELDHGHPHEPGQEHH